MVQHPVARIVLLVVQAFVAVTAIAGGIVLALGAVVPSLATVLSPPVEYLDGSPFDGYLIPGILLAVALGGVHLVAFILLLRRSPVAPFAAAVAAFDTLIWIFVQMIYIPFSFLQAVYFAAGIAEVGFLLVMLGLLTLRTERRHLAA